MEMHTAQSLYTVHGIGGARPGSSWRLLKWMGARLARIGEALEHEARLRETIADLSSRDDHLLDDIGVRRADIEAFVRSPMLGDVSGTGSRQAFPTAKRPLA